MNISSLLIVLCLLINSSKCGLEIFKFKSQPESKPVNPGGSVSLSCVATGRTGITYSWYKLATSFSTPPSESSDLISGETGTQYVVLAADVDEKDDKSLFQCKATAGDDVILSNVATVKYTLADNIEYDSTGKSYIDEPASTPNDDQEYGVFLFKLQCNANEVDFNKFITNGKPYDVQWFKAGDKNTRVEDKYNNMWTYYSNQADPSNLKVHAADGFEPDLGTVKPYDLVIFNVQKSDVGTYSCKAVSRANKKEVLLGSTVLTVPVVNNDYPFKPLNMVTGYMVLAVDDTGKVKSTPNFGDRVLLMCGAPCRTSSGSYDPQYQWKNSSGTVIANTREHIVTAASNTNAVTYTCEILNSECNTDVSSKDVTITAKDTEINPMLPFTFSKSSPDYMWYDTSDDTESHTPFEIGCEGSSGNVNFFNVVYKMPTPLTGASATEIYNFGSSYTSDKSGVYQCAMYNNPNKVLWYQKTTNVVIAAPPTAAIVPTIISVKHDATATFTCTVGGYPVKSVKISGPNSLDLDCISSQSSGDVTCSSTDKKKYVVNVQNFELSDAGNYRCTVETEWYKSRSSSAITTSAHDEVTLSFESTTKLTASSNPANKGSSVTLTCVVKGNPEPSKPVLTKTVSSSTTNITMKCTGTTTKTCEKEFSFALYTDSGDYTCNGENLIDNVKKSSSDTLTLSIDGDADATLVQNPAGTELNKDSSVAFTCKIEGNPRPTKLIFKKGSTSLKSYDANTGSSDSDILKETYDISYIHTISPLALDDTGVYTCENDTSGIKTDTATKTLTVVSDVVITIAASSTTPTVGSTFTITCTATGGRKPHSVELKQGDTLISGTVFSCSDDGDYSKKCTYQHTAGYTSGGTYSCIGKNRVASNVERNATKTLDISLSKKVAVSLTPSSDAEIEVTYDSAYTITCNVEGADRPHKVTLNIPDSSTDLIWQRDSSGSALKCNGEFQLVCKYTIVNLAYSHEGQYTCTGYNKLPGENSDRTDDASVSLVVVKNVEVKLTDSINTNDNEVYFGNLFTITCVANGGRIPFYLEFSHTPTISSRRQLVLYDSSSSTTPDSVKIDHGANTLTYVHSVTSSSYDDNGTYTCSSKNKAAVNAEENDKKDASILVVKNVASTITTPAIVDKGSQFTITCVAEGYRAPHYIALEKDDVTEKTWVLDSTECTPLFFYKLQCEYIVASSGYLNHGKYTCVSKNNALGNKEVSSKDSKNVQISQTVLTELIPNSEKELKMGGPNLTMICDIEGGLQPHKATLELPGGSMLTWNRDTTTGVIQNSLTCTGENEIQCVHEVMSTTYDSSGKYTCTGYNKLPNDTNTDHSKSKNVDVIIVKDVMASISSNLESDEVNWGTELKLTCKVEGGRTPFYLLVQFTDGAGANSTVIEFNESKQLGTIVQRNNSLEYVHVIDNVAYTDNGSYMCKGKNRALGNAEKTSEALKNAVVVKNVEIDPIADIEADFGRSFTFSFTLNGGRSPHSVTLDSPGSSRLFNWRTGGSECIGTNTLSCSYTIGGSDVNFGADGTFTVTAKNKARNDDETTAKKTVVVTVYKDVSAAISPNSDSDITYHEDKTITCKVEGGLPPHQVDLFLGNKGTKTWKKDGTETSLACTGNHTLTCEHTFTPEYDSDGDYKCKGYNVVRSVAKVKESASVRLTTVRSTIVSVSSASLSVLTDGTIKVDCIVVGKPLVDKSSVTWTHETVTSLDLTEFVNTTKGSADDYTLISTLIIPSPPKKYSGVFKCNVGNQSESVQVSIHYKEFLDRPQVSHNFTGETIEKGVRLAVTCRVQGFPRPIAFLLYENVEDGAFKQNVTLKDSKFESDTSTVFVYVLTTKCEYSQYKFMCETQTTKENNKTVLTKSILSGPHVTGCDNMLPVIGGGVGGGVVFIIIIVVAVVCILKKIRGNKSDSFSPKNGTQIPNPAFSPDPSYATVGDTRASLGYSHLNRPAGVEAADNYDSIAHLKPNAMPVDEDSYQTLDTASNGRLGHQRKKSDEVYAALNRPAPGKEKRGVVRKYRPIANKPRNTFGSPPNKRLTENIEMGETSHSSQPEPTYATVNPQTMKSREKPSEYADVTLPDLPPEVPEYGQMSRQPMSSEYADVTIPQPPPSSSEYADVTIPGFVPEVPLYSNMGEMQESDPAEDPVYAQVDLRSRSAKKPQPVEDEEDLPPDVPVYGTMGELTEPDNPVDDEDPYATVEFVPKSKRKPPRPKVKESTGDGVYATITDIKENP